MTVDCEIFPRQSLASRDLKRLGSAFQAFAAANSGRVTWVDYLAIEDLRKGEHPKPLLLRISEHSQRATNVAVSRSDTILLDASALAMPEATPQNVLQWRQARGQHIADRSLPFVLRGNAEIGELVVSLRKHIADNLVDDVLIGNQSWKQF